MRIAKRSVGIALALSVAAILGFQTPHANETSPIASPKTRRAVDQARIEAIKRQSLDLRQVRASLRGDRPLAPDAGRTIVVETSPLQTVSQSAAASPPPPSPGLALAQTSYDFQGEGWNGYQTARASGADIVHFIWMSWDRIPRDIDDNDRSVNYQSYTVSGGNFIQPFGGVAIGGSTLARAGFGNGAVFEDNTFQATLHQREDPNLPYGPWHLGFPTPGNASHIAEGLSGLTAPCNEALWPLIAASRDGDRTLHILAHSNVNDCPIDLLWYWRYNGASWTGPVPIDSTPLPSYAIADDPTGDKVAVAVHVDNYTAMNGLNNVAYLESATDGAGWIDGTEPIVKHVITNYSNPQGPQAWLHISTCYDNSGILHIAFDMQHEANASTASSIKHWNSLRNTIRTAVDASWSLSPLPGLFNLNVSELTMGIGDGATPCRGGAESNNNYVYIVYTRFGGQSQAEQEDISALGYANGELYLAMSPTGGLTWGPSVNLTNTKTPQCNPGPADTLTGIPQRPDSVCRSEHWASIGLVVSDLDIFFISDLDAGAAVLGEGTWQLNPVHYLRLPGGTTDAQYLCPNLAPNFAAILAEDPVCEFHAPTYSQTQTTLTIMNLGNAELTGDVSVSDFPGNPTLAVSAPGPYSIPAGDPDLILTVTMTANGGPEGMYTGSIAVTHNDPSQPSPQVFPVEFFVFDEFFCPESPVIMKTGVASPGSLALLVENNGRIADQYDKGGLWRHSDSSWSVFDASLLIAHGPQSPDTTVFLRFYDRPSNGQYGFRPLSDLIIDTSAYGTGMGCAYASTRLCTRDSVVGISVEWAFPQDYAKDEFVIARYRIYRHNPQVPVTDLAIGLLADLNAMPAKRLGAVQYGAANTPVADMNRNLLGVQGSDTAGHVPVGQNTATRFRAGIATRAPFGYAQVGNAYTDLQPGGGPSDGFLYRILTLPANGADMFVDSAADLYTLFALDRGRSLAPAETLTYVAIFASDTISEASFLATVDAGLALACSPDLCSGVQCACPCWADPECDMVRSDVLDVVATLNVAFRGAGAILDPGCPVARSDVDANGVTDIVDAVKVVGVAFRGQMIAATYIDPCFGCGD
ncbi:MAG TPA: hypothetical protein VNN55_00740 [bacterium]|nr:hypothetical protein [bacterium]